MTCPRRRHRSSASFRLKIIAVFVVAAFSFSGCGGGSSSAENRSTTPTSTSNVQAVAINAGPATKTRATDLLYASLTVCVPGSSTQCETIGGIVVDTGSSGLRILASALTISLPQQKDSGGNPIAECAQFADGETWGPVQTADVSLAGEKAGSVPIQVIGSTAANVAKVPTTCSNMGPIEDDVNSLEANGIIGVGNFIQDCGEACAVSGSQNAGFYYSCPAAGCEVFAEPLTSQVSNPVAFFATDNNGVIIQLPAVSAPEAALSGSMIFGIGTQSDNALSGQTIYTLDPNTGNTSTTFKGTTYTDAAFLDTGSNAYYFLNSAATGMSKCTDLTFWYCPASTQNLTATNTGHNGATGNIDFSIGNADTLTANVNNRVIPNIGGPNTGTFDWGLPFFFGRTVYVAFEGKSTPSGSGPFWAY
jgi:hypothetical protein